MSGADERIPGAEDNSTPSERTETEQRTLDELKHGQWWAYAEISGGTPSAESDCWPKRQEHVR